jgi:aromatic ring hydroxylase
LPAHKYILAFRRVIHNALRLAANSVKTAEQRLQARNREVLLEAGREATERMIEREFERVENTVTHDLALYPALQRKLSEKITRIDEDYQQSTEVPLDPPDWCKVVESVASIDSNGDAMVAQILKDIHKSMIMAQDKAIKEHRREYMDRLEDWQRRVEEGGGTWRLINDMDRLERIISG